MVYIFSQKQVAVARGDLKNVRYCDIVSVIVINSRFTFGQT